MCCCYLQNFNNIDKQMHDIHSESVMLCWMIVYRVLQGLISKVMIVAERGEGANTFTAFFNRANVKGYDDG